MPLWAQMGAGDYVVIVVAVGLLMDRVLSYFREKDKNAAENREKAAKAEREAEKERSEIEYRRRSEERAEAVRLAAQEVARVQEESAKLQVKAAQKVETTLAKVTTENAAGEAAVLVKLDNIAQTGEKVHLLVNSAMSAQLKIAAVALRRVADLTKHPDDVAAAKLAEDGLHEHEKKQKVVDAGGKMESDSPPEKAP